MFLKFRQVVIASWTDQAFGRSLAETPRASTGARPGQGSCWPLSASVLFCSVHPKLHVLYVLESWHLVWVKNNSERDDGVCYSSVHIALLQKSKGYLKRCHPLTQGVWFRRLLQNWLCSVFSWETQILFGFTHSVLNFITYSIWFSSWKIYNNLRSKYLRFLLRK